MLETNKPYMFSSTTTTTTTTTNSNVATTSSSPVQTPLQINNSSRPMDHLQQQQRPMHHTNFYSTTFNNRQEEEEQQPLYSSYLGQPTRLNSAFGRHQENNYTYKTNLHNNNTRPLVYSTPPPPPPPVTVIKREEPTLLIPPPSLPNTSEEQTESSWFDNTMDIYTDSSDNKRIKRRKEMTSKMEKLNTDFLDKKDSLYTEKLILVNSELKEFHQDKHTFYLDDLRNLKELRQKMIDDGQLFKEYQKQVTDKQFQLEIYQAEEEYTAETQEIREKLFTVLEEKRRKLKEDKDNCDLAYDVVMESQSRMHKRNLRKRGPENVDNKSNKRKQLNGPALVFRLKDEDIHSDMQAMKCGISSLKKK